MSDNQQTTERPVVIYYPEADPDRGYLGGASMIVTTPSAAREHHPNARILRYEDGQAYSDRKNRTEVKEADEAAPEASTPRKTRGPGRKASAPATGVDVAPVAPQRVVDSVSNRQSLMELDADGHTVTTVDVTDAGH